MSDPDPTEQPSRHYRHPVWDTARWKGFVTRPDDILICTPYKAGTTWMQMICALLIFQRTTFNRPLSDISPWLEMKAAEAEVIHDIYNTQTHRRLIKTHTPLDGLPWRPEISYICVLRDPRDIFMSMLNHMKNANPDANALFMSEMREQGPAPELPEDPNEFFRYWLSHGSFDWESDGAPYWSVFRHGYSYWRQKERANITLVHYSDLKHDLGAGMRRIAQFLNIDVPEEKWPDLVDAARFDNMKARADQMAPDTRFDMWKDNSRFFNKGTSGQWRDVLDEHSLAMLQKVTDGYPAEYINWLFRD